jgi:hypothetical protein
MAARARARARGCPPPDSSSAAAGAHWHPRAVRRAGRERARGAGQRHSYGDGVQGDCCRPAQACGTPAAASAPPFPPKEKGLPVASHSQHQSFSAPAPLLGGGSFPPAAAAIAALRQRSQDPATRRGTPWYPPARTPWYPLSTGAAEVTTDADSGLFGATGIRGQPSESRPPISGLRIA